METAPDDNVGGNHANWGQGTQGVDSNENPQRRVIIRTRVTNIDGAPEDRVRNMGQIFCSHVLKRPLRTGKGDDERLCDALHFLPLCDSPHPVHAWFMYDLGFDGTAQDLARIRHEVYLASLIDGQWIFTRRDVWSDEGRKRSSIYPWGGRPKSKSVEAASKLW